MRKIDEGGSGDSDGGGRREEERNTEEGERDGWMEARGRWREEQRFLNVSHY